MSQEKSEFRTISNQNCLLREQKESNFLCYIGNFSILQVRNYFGPVWTKLVVTGHKIMHCVFAGV